ncbi:rhodanese-like domain-containing protein [Georgenia satyanarayanai]|uniref:rhodanese-like domain-containing protein n=1 Tax=Georgenia satyanarayanai TaxID=860221 RepID=UPI0020413E9D|nr:rhodanese-like domain-containing protein [Georgenia satyanarayanai]MCM3661254.1 rhodanese-like domain-containing protein [Georgenia satyanarayanai]
MDDLDQPSDLTVGDLDPAAPVPAGHAVLDVREQDEWDAGHIPGAVHIPLGELPDRLDDLPEEDLLVVCRSGGRSMRATAWLNHSGFTARNLDGGMHAWGAAGLAMTADEGRDPYVL